MSTGRSMALSRTRSIGIDPAYEIRSQIHCNVQLVRAESDAFFARPNPLKHFRGLPIDFAFIDGMHLAEFALRDFMNVERFMSPAGIVVIDDILPRTAVEASRDRVTDAWTGDVFKLFDIFAEQRPDLMVIPLNTGPTGTALIIGCDPSSTILQDNYAANLTKCLAGDPQSVSDAVLHRTIAADPRILLSSDVWTTLTALRDSGADRAEVVTAVRPLVENLVLTRVP